MISGSALLEGAPRDGTSVGALPLRINLIGLGPTALALVTDSVFGRDDALRFSLASASTVVVLEAAALFRAGLAPYRRLAEST